MSLRRGKRRSVGLLPTVLVSPFDVPQRPSDGVHCWTASYLDPAAVTRIVMLVALAQCGNELVAEP
jgi:hypothetical protein